MSSSLGLPQFSHIDIKSFNPHLEAMLKRNLEEVDRLLKSNHCYTWDNLMYPLEDLDDALERFWSPFSHLSSVMDSKPIRESHEACLPLLSAYESAIGQNQELYKAIKSIKKEDLNAAQQKIVEDALLDFELSGVALSKKEKKKFEVIQTKLSELENQFENNILDATDAFSIHLETADRLAGLPQHALEAAKALATQKKLKGYVLSLEYPCYQAVVTYAKDRALREEMYQAYVTRASDLGPQAGQFDNTPLMQEILSLRQEEAKMLGFDNYASLSLATKMADSTSQVLGFMTDLVDKARPQAIKELQALEEFAASIGHEGLVKPWDLAYLSELRRQKLFTLSQEELRPYFTQTKVMQGLFAIVKRLYGISIEEIKGEDTWHKEVQCFCLVDEKNKLRGYVYTDLFARPHKKGGAWMDSLQSRRLLADGQIQVPIATLTCNFAKPPKDKEATLSHDEVITLFHEFGHCLHHLLTQVDYLDASGINGVEWDAVELPSQFFENWCWDKEALNGMTAHVETGEPLPLKLYDSLMASKNFQSAIAMLRQMEFSLFDFRIHQELKENKADLVQEVLSQVRSKTSIIKPTSYNRFQNSFSHIFGGGYAAGYYSYSWAEVLSCDAFSRFEEEGLFNPITGRDFLECILEVGGSKTATQAFKDFRGREANIDAFLRHNGIEV